MMQIFSRICAKFSPECKMFLPSYENVNCFINNLIPDGRRHVEAIMDEKDGDICLWGDWESIVVVKHVLQCYFKDHKKEQACQVFQSETSCLASNAIDEKKPSSLNVATEGNNMNEDCDMTDIDECLNIEVIHPRAKEDLKKKSYKYSCTLCSFKSQRESHFLKHITLHQSISTVFRCHQCDFSTLRFTHLRRHQIIHSNTSFTCSSCSYSTDDPKLLSRHQRVKHKTIQNPASDSVQSAYHCTECPYETNRLYLYQRHMKVHSAEESVGGSNLFICSQCDYRTSRKMHYVRHVRDVHYQCRPYLCHQCGKAFKRPDALKQHNLLHNSPGTDLKLLKFQCRQCNKMCRSRAHLKEHQAVHSSERSFLCEICGASFKTRSVQRKHVATLHSNPRAYPCALCTKRFNTNYALKRHMKQHQTNAATEDVESDANKVVTIVLPDSTNQSMNEDTLTLTVKLNSEQCGPTLLYLPDSQHIG